MANSTTLICWDIGFKSATQHLMDSGQFRISESFPPIQNEVEARTSFKPSTKARLPNFTFQNFKATASDKKLPVKFHTCLAEIEILLTITGNSQPQTAIVKLSLFTITMNIKSNSFCGSNDVCYGGALLWSFCLHAD